MHRRASRARQARSEVGKELVAPFEPCPARSELWIDPAFFRLDVNTDENWDSLHEHSFGVNSSVLCQGVDFIFVFTLLKNDPQKLQLQTGMVKSISLVSNLTLMLWAAPSLRLA